MLDTRVHFLLVTVTLDMIVRVPCNISSSIYAVVSMHFQQHTSTLAYNQSGGPSQGGWLMQGTTVLLSRAQGHLQRWRQEQGN